MRERNSLLPLTLLRCPLELDDDEEEEEEGVEGAAVGAGPSAQSTQNVSNVYLHEPHARHRNFLFLLDICLSAALGDLASIHEAPEGLMLWNALVTCFRTLSMLPLTKSGYSCN